MNRLNGNLNLLICIWEWPLTLMILPFRALPDNVQDAPWHNRHTPLLNPITLSSLINSPKFWRPVTATRANRTLSGSWFRTFLIRVMSLSPLSHRLRCWRMCGTNFSVLMVWCLTKVNGGVSQSSISTAPVTAAWTKPVKSISTISVISRLMTVVWKTSIW